MAQNRRFVLFLVAYGIGIAVSQINYDVTYEVRMLAVVFIAAVGFLLFNALFDKWEVKEGANHE